jgi:hypothetical protein
MVVCDQCKKRRQSREEALQMKESFDDGTQKLILTNCDSLGEFHQGNQDTSSIPNIIWMFWEGPMNHVVETCIESWKFYNPTYDIRVLNKSNCATYTDVHVATHILKDDSAKRGVQRNMDIYSLRHANENNTRFSDFLRAIVLSKHGGFWVDASIICHHPISWVHAIQRSYQVEFVGYYTGNKSMPTVENWFFACVPDSAFMRDWCQEFVRFNEFPSANDYLSDVRNQGINLDNMPYLDYLTMHASAQQVLQSHPDTYRIYLFCANSGPLLYIEQVGWDYPRAVDLLTNTDTCESFYQYTMIKLPNGPRNEMLHRKLSDVQRAIGTYGSSKTSLYWNLRFQ